ncbi:hypothetical protein HOD08_04780 [bacterium]|nr:hypothetical protein [bacterium]
MKTNFLAAALCTIATHTFVGTVYCGNGQSQEPANDSERQPLVRTTNLISMEQLQKVINHNYGNVPAQVSPPKQLFGQDKKMQAVAIQREFQKVDYNLATDAPTYNPEWPPDKEEWYVNKLIKTCSKYLESGINADGLEKALVNDVLTDGPLAQIGFEIIALKTNGLLLEHGFELLELALHGRLEAINDKLIEILEPFKYSKIYVWASTINIVYASLCAVEGGLRKNRPGHISKEFSMSIRSRLKNYVASKNIPGDPEKLLLANEIMRQLIGDKDSAPNHIRKIIDSLRKTDAIE